MKRKDRIYAFIGFKPKGRHPNRDWPAFSFDPGVSQDDAEAFMTSIFVPARNCWYLKESQLLRSKTSPVKYSFNHINYGEIWAYDTPVRLSWRTSKGVRIRTYTIK